MSTILELLPEIEDSKEAALYNPYFGEIAGTIIANNHPGVIVGKYKVVGILPRRNVYIGRTYKDAWKLLAEKHKSNSWEIVSYEQFKAINAIYNDCGL